MPGLDAWIDLSLPVCLSATALDNEVMEYESKGQQLELINGQIASALKEMNAHEAAERQVRVERRLCIPSSPFASHSFSHLPTTH